MIETAIVVCDVDVRAEIDNAQDKGMDNRVPGTTMSETKRVGG